MISRPPISSDQARIALVGDEQVPVVEADGLSGDPRGLVEEACGLAWSRTSPHYPGVRAAAPSATVQALLTPLAGLLRERFALAGRVRVVSCEYSLVTTPPAQLSPIQRLPHVDVPEPGRVAVLLYLCPPSHGGTALFRHRATGLQTLTSRSFREYLDVLRSEIDAHGPPAGGYLDDGEPLFERLHVTQAAFNRVVIYPSNAPHCGQIAPACPLSPDPREGRLTLNAFLAG
jgi:hypothetical protein